MQLYICSYEGKIRETMAKHNGSEFWDVCIEFQVFIYSYIQKKKKESRN